MFSRMQLLADSAAIAQRFHVVDCPEPSFVPREEIIGFEHALHPILLQTENGIICRHAHWGLVPPNWRKEPETIWSYTISAKLEYLDRRFAWIRVAQNRCLVPATAYYEYRWNDSKGLSKTKYLIKSSYTPLFALAGLYSVWQHPNGGTLWTFAVCTTKANALMERIHNKDADKDYHRMPVMIRPGDEAHWLNPETDYNEFAFPHYRPNLVATAFPVDSEQMVLPL